MRYLAGSLFIVAVMVAAALFARQAAAKDPLVPHDQSVYEAKALVSIACSKCHGYNGVSISPLFPILAAQQAKYIEAQLQSFRQRARSDPHARAFMWGIAKGLTDEQIEGLADYFSSQPRAAIRAASNSALAEKGKLIYENGLPERELLGCIGCHGPKAEGIRTFPRLAGQHRDYIELQLQHFTGQHYSAQLRESEIMHRFSQNMSDNEIAAVAEYLASK